MTGERKDPYLQFNFVVEIDGVNIAGFTEVGGVGGESDVVEYREGSDPPILRKLPGILKFANISLKRGYTDVTDLWDWRKTSLDGKTERKAGSIVLLDEGRKEVLRWNFREAWVAKYDGPPLNSATAEAAIESIELAHEGIELA